jgi:hypothetical protein
VVIERVPHHYAVGTDGLGDLGEKSITHLAGRLFKRGASFAMVTLDITLVYCDRGTETTGQVGHITGIGSGLSTSELVVKVSNMQLHP